MGNNCFKFGSIKLIRVPVVTIQFDRLSFDFGFFDSVFPKS